MASEFLSKYGMSVKLSLNYCSQGWTIPNLVLLLFLTVCIKYTIYKTPLWQQDYAFNSLLFLQEPTAPNFGAICNYLQQPASKLLYWSPNDSTLRSQVDVLGAPLRRSAKLFPDLQDKYRHTKT
jgi:hypothetical protein